MSEPAKNVPPTMIDLSGVPALGPVRRRLLTEAGITSRASLAKATLEQVIAVTGMPRSVAEQVLAFVAQSVARGHEAKNTEDVVSNSLADSSTLPTDHPSPLVNSLPVSGEDAPQTIRLERAALRAQTAIADASRRTEPGSKLSETLLRFARLTDELPRRVTPETRGGVLRRITERIEAISERLETVAVTKKEDRPLGTKRAKRLQQRLKRTRDSIKRTLKISASN